MKRRTGHRLRERDERLAGLVGSLRQSVAGLHELAPPASVLDSELPDSVQAVYRLFDGGSLFHEALLLRPAARVRRREGRWVVGELGSDDLSVDDGGVVWRVGPEAGDIAEEGTAFDRWLLGFVDAEAYLFDAEGEYRDGIFDDSGELTSEAEIEREKRQLRRDRRAVEPRRRLARAYARCGQLETARDLLEGIVGDRPECALAWFDLAGVSESLGDLAGACDEACAAAEASAQCRALFYGHAARLAGAAGDEHRRAELAARAQTSDPRLVGAQVEAGEEALTFGDIEAARRFAELAVAVAPRDLTAVDLLRRIDAAAGGSANGSS